jgi:hypothetical protein
MLMEKHTANSKKSQIPACSRALLFNLKMEAVGPFETLVNIYTTSNIRRLHIRESLNSHNFNKVYLKYVTWRMLSSGMQCCVARRKSTEVSEEHIASIFRVE